MKRMSVQNGSVSRSRRTKGPDVWVFRFKQKGVYRSVQLGSVQKHTSKAAAVKHARTLGLLLEERSECITVGDLIAKYKNEDMPARKDTAASYSSYLKRIKERWGKERLDVMSQNVMAIEQWINGLRTLPNKEHPDGARELSKRTRRHMKALVHRLFECAIRRGHLAMQRNPVGLVAVKGNGKRVRQLITVTVEQYWELLEDEQLPDHVRVMIEVAMCLGLGASEVLGLQWPDIDFEAGLINICRSVVGDTQDAPKTVNRASEVPLHSDLASMLQQWRVKAPEVGDWVFGSLTTGRPYHRDSLQTDHLKPAGERVGIQGLGWHAFRHTYRALLRDLELPLEVQQKLMRHGDIRTTMGYGGDNMLKLTRPANAKVVEMIRRAS